MAEDKKSFVMYADLIHVIRKLVEQDRLNKTNYAGELFLHIWEYVNDNEPIPINFIIDMAFEPIKQQLKRDLSRYADKKIKFSEAGKKSAEAKRLAKIDENVSTKSTNVENVKTNTTFSTVNVNDTVNVNVTDILLEKETKGIFSFEKSLIELGVEKDLASDWLKVRKTKKLTNTKTAFKNLKIEFEKSGKKVNEIVNHCVTQSWGGYKSSWKWEDNNSQKPNQNNSENLIHTN